MSPKKKSPKKKAAKKKVAKTKPPKKKAAKKKARAALDGGHGPNDYRGYCVTEKKPINRRWKTETEAEAEADQHHNDLGHEVDIEERQ